jgi:excisionase family DNA binding protein
MEPTARPHESTTAHDRARDGQSDKVVRTGRGGRRRGGHDAPHTETHPTGPGHLPRLLTPGEVAALLRTSKKAVYAMIERAQLPGIVRIGRRVLLRETDLLDWLGQNTTPSLER